MRSIEVLDENTIDKIAAGEVVERPASVVKELTENAIDASATAITVEIRDGGTTFMRITDNGGGIPADQVRKAFLRHATSKIRKVEDLAHIASLGFRGEALSSIAAVAKVECITKTPEALTGVRYCIEGGRETECEEIGAPSGTTFIIRNLFYNTPARAKFLKSPQAEAGHVASFVEELALSHPEISFKYIQNGQNKIYTSGNGNLREIVYQIYGRELMKEMIEIDTVTNLMHLHGYIGSPSASRGNRNYENYFVNGRYVKSAVISKAIEDAYHGFLMQHRYPFTLLYLDMNGEAVDVNVHPQKLEVRFSNREELYHEICLAIQNALMHKERIPEVSVGREQAEKNRPIVTGRGAPEPFERERRAQESGRKAIEEKNLKTEQPENREAGKAPDREDVSAPPRRFREDESPYVAIPEMPAKMEDAPAANQAPAAKTAPATESVPPVKDDQKTRESAESRSPLVKKPEQISMFEENRVLSEQARRMYRMIGPLFDTYWLFEYRDSLYIMDQHAAHEKVNYERMMKNYREKKVNSQMLYPSIVLELSAEEARAMSKYSDVFSRFGFEIEPFGGKSWKISAVPDNLYSVATEDLFYDILSQLTEIGDVSPELIPEKLASMSCKAAVKGNRKISEKEAEALLDELLTLENPYNCPHGRPTIISMSKYEIDRKFKRIV